MIPQGRIEEQDKKILFLTTGLQDLETWMHEL
jgi:hypothetical protein